MVLCQSMSPISYPCRIIDDPFDFYPYPADIIDAPGARCGGKTWLASTYRPGTFFEAIVCSHGHFDHTTGLSGLLDVLRPANLPVVIHSRVLEPS